MNLLEQITVNTAPGPFYESDDKSLSAPVNPLVRLIAFYLPQFHAVPENDLWWGEGFTEWTNATKAIPRFAGHYQPRLPGALGFYDATRPEVLVRQAEMAKRYGVAGFCFHYYWFAGKRILQKPLETLLAHPEIDLPFCVNWANESWTRRWESQEKDILLKQDYPPDDDLAFARALEPLFRDKRYIRIDGRPLLLIYRSGLLPDHYVPRWRDYFRSAGLGDPFIAMVQTQGTTGHDSYGMDAGVGFPPFWTCFDIPMRNDLELLDTKFTGGVRPYHELAESVMASYAKDRQVFPGVVPSWDNEARKPQRGGVCFSGSTPALYGRWLKAACAASLRGFAGDERLVFINAWNEWAEGAYLEPDRHFGFAYLAETRRVLDALTPETATTSAMTDLPQWSGLEPTLSRQIKRLVRLAINGIANYLEALAWKLRGR